MLKAIRMIKAANPRRGSHDDNLIVDVHPSRPDYRGFVMGDHKIVSLEADPRFEEMEEAGATIHKHHEAHTILDDMFLVSGEIPRKTRYETGLKYGMRFDQETGEWFSDEKVADERFLMCNLKGISRFLSYLILQSVKCSTLQQIKGSSCSLAAAMPA
jgi:7,8-dihydropterin-6-yl-methyl-4-(beta-D-ribofuranosyl)aminobenzene 5'-phosphate synthase